MNRRRFLLIALAGAMLASPALAQTVVDRVVAMLQRAGYGNIEVGRTLLGRVRITGRRDDRTREIVLNPRSGEILRDIVFGPDGRSLTSGLLEDDDDDSRDDDSRDDDDDDDSGGDDDSADD